MKSWTRCISSFLLVAALAAPTALRALPAPLDARQPGNAQRNDQGSQRIYDPSHRDWHEWNDREERAFRMFMVETLRDYRDFFRLNERDQIEYWNWRHGHSDAMLDMAARPPQRFNDRNARDWHDWNDDEERAYRHYLAENRRDYREFGRLNDRDQAEYWRWRHSHPDWQHDRGGSGRHYYDQNTGRWHDWDDREDRAFRRFMEDNHRPYVDFDHADLGLQLQFWLWRQFHSDRGDEPPRRYYDNDRREWHDWNEREERSYRFFLSSNGRVYIDFSSAPVNLQIQYWSWRRGHPDQDDRNFKRYYDPGNNDWHIWDENEDRAYREFMRGRNWYYRELPILNPRDQQRYFDWRHKHPDRDRR
jgi:hypothetical protein